MPLTEQDYRALEACYITRDIADRAGIRRVDSLEGRERMGRKGAGNYAGLLFSYSYPGEPGVRGERLRLDHPPLDPAGKTQYRYLSPPGQRNQIYFPPGIDPAWLKDVSIPVVLTEGEKKCLALWCAAIEVMNQSNGTGGGKPPFLPLAFSGVWNWRGQIGIGVNANGQRSPIKGPIPDLGRIAWGPQRRAVICYDANAATNDSVRWARAQLACQLETQNARAYLIDLPASQGVNGVDDFLARVGLADFLDLLIKATRHDWRSELARSAAGKILPTLDNISQALRLAPEWHGVIGFNSFTLTIEQRRPLPSRSGGPLEREGPWRDVDDLNATVWMEQHGIYAGDAHVSKALQIVAAENPFHPVLDYLEGLRWDGIGRLDDWLTVYLGADPGPHSRDEDEEEQRERTEHYFRAVGRSWLIGAVARIFEPGCKMDNTLILEGPQGVGKTTVFSILGGPFYSGDMPDLGTKDSKMAMRGIWIMEISELDAMNRGEISKIKHFLSEKADRYRPPYGRHMVLAPRQTVFGGSINHGSYLRDDTGGRRFWPVACGQIRLESLAKDRDQLLAEAAHRYRQGEHWWLEDALLIDAAGLEQDERFQADAWEELIKPWVESKTRVTTGDILRGALAKEPGHWERRDEVRVGFIMSRLRWKRVRQMIDGQRDYFYQNPKPAAAAKNAAGGNGGNHRNVF